MSGRDSKDKKRHCSLFLLGTMPYVLLYSVSVRLLFSDGSLSGK